MFIGKFVFKIMKKNTKSCNSHCNVSFVIHTRISQNLRKNVQKWFETGAKNDLPTLKQEVKRN